MESGHKRPRALTVVMAVFNEAATAREAIEGVLAVKIPEVQIDLVIVESNSTDGTRDIVCGYESNPRVTLILEAVPQGKGWAVRQGLEIAQGEIILIQDADLEYSFDDYPALLAPIIEGRASFVLGTRHDLLKPMRTFNNARVLSHLMNFAHKIFTTLFNLVYRTKLTDPFTMYKVFKRSCITGLTFSSKRFDFDWEIVAKLVRRGYVPVEVPVSYESRDYAEGKKVRFFRDPVTWIVALVKFRFVKVDALSDTMDS
jgi:glycosyltransferase involved in cell wall biosynthesis